MKHELCVFSLVLNLLLLLIISDPTVALRVYRNNEYEVSEIDKRIEIPRPPVQHLNTRRHGIPRIQHRAVNRRNRIRHVIRPQKVLKKRGRIAWKHQQHQHRGLKRQEIIHALSEDSDKGDPDDDIESLGRRIDETGNEIKEIKEKGGEISEASKPDKHAAAATKYIISKIKEIQDKLFKRTGNKELEEKLNQMATPPTAGMTTPRSNKENKTTVSPINETANNVTTPTATIANTTSSSNDKKDTNATSNDKQSTNATSSPKAVEDSSNAPERRKIIPEEVVDKILEKFQQLKQEAKHIATSESRHSVEHAEEERYGEMCSCIHGPLHHPKQHAKHIHRNVTQKRRETRHMHRKMTQKRRETRHRKPKANRNKSSLNRTYKTLKGKKIIDAQASKRTILGKRKQEKDNSVFTYNMGKLMPKKSQSTYTSTMGKLIPKKSGSVQGSKRTMSILGNGRALLNYKSSTIGSNAELPLYRGNPAGYLDPNMESIEALRDQLQNNPYADFSTKAGVALPNLPPTLNVFGDTRQTISPPTAQDIALQNVSSTQNLQNTLDLQNMVNMQNFQSMENVVNGQNMGSMGSPSQQMESLELGSNFDTNPLLTQLGTQSAAPSLPPSIDVVSQMESQAMLLGNQRVGGNLGKRRIAEQLRVHSNAHTNQLITSSGGVNPAIQNIIQPNNIISTPQVQPSNHNAGQLYGTGAHPIHPLGLSPSSQFNSQMTVFGNEERDVLNMVSGLASRDLPPMQGDMAQQPLVTNPEIDFGNNPRAQMSTVAGVAFPYQPPTLDINQ